MKSFDRNNGFLFLFRWFLLRLTTTYINKIIYCYLGEVGLHRKTLFCSAWMMVLIVLPHLSALAKTVTLLSSTGGPLTLRCKWKAESCPEAVALLCWADGWFQQRDESVHSSLYWTANTTLLCFFPAIFFPLGGPTSFSDSCSAWVEKECDGC